MRRAVAFGLALAVLACSRDAARPGRIRDAFSVADSLREEDLIPAALTEYQRLADSFNIAGDSAQHFRAQIGRAWALRWQGKLDSAVAEDPALAAVTKDPEWEGWDREVAARRMITRAQYDSARAETERMLVLGVERGDRRLQSRAHSIQGTIHSHHGRYQLASEAAARAVAIERTRGFPIRLAIQLNNLGIEYRRLGRLTEAEATYREGLQLAPPVGTSRASMLLSANFSSVKAETGELDVSAELLATALRVAEARAESRMIVGLTADLGELYLTAGNLSEARRVMDRWLENWQQATVFHQTNGTLILARLELLEGRLTEAAPHLDSALVWADRNQLGGLRVTARVQLAQLALARNQLATALRRAEEAVALARTLDSPTAELEAQEVRAQALERMQRSEAAGAYLDALAGLETLRGRQAMGDLRGGVTDLRNGLFEGAIRTQLGGGRAAEAWAVAERARARLLLELMAERDASRPASSRRAELARTLRLRLEERGAVVAADSAEQVSLNRELGILHDSLTRQEPELHPLNLDGLAQLQRTVLTPGRALLAFFWGEGAVYGWWVTGDSIRAVRLGAADSLGALVEFLRETVAGNTADSLWRGPAHRAWLELIAPLSPKPVEEILIIADGPLTRLPFEVLLPDAAGSPWGATTRIAYAPSAGVLLALAGRPAADAARDRAILTVGDPAVPASSASTGPGVERASPGAQLGRLPFAAEESRQIASLFHAERADLLLGRRATAANWLGREPARYRYLHFAVHAVVDDRRPDRTGLALADGDFDLARIRASRLDADLVTLSACETALGRRVRGEGVIGLPHAFLSAGARGVVVSLWRVRDKAAAEFMTEFYGRLNSGLSPAAALADVRRSLIARQAPPSEWAAFVLVGGFDPAPVQ